MENSKRLKRHKRMNTLVRKLWNKNKVTIKDFESILVSEDNAKQNPNQSYTEKYQKHIACSYG